jgi:hypothetical protein
LQTYLYLRKSISCKITPIFPDKGIVVTHRDFIHFLKNPFTTVYLVCIKPDRKEHSWAHYHIVQNLNDDYIKKNRGNSFSMIHFWPQPSLIPRNPDRGTICKNVGYFGRLSNLAKELQSAEWKEKLQRAGFNWIIVPKDKWNDYSDIDVTVSVRSFQQGEKKIDPVFDFDSKPPSKLINSWHAGVPAILGLESAYKTLHTNEYDYIEATSAGQLIQALSRLKESPGYYNKMVENGFKRGKEYTVGKIRSEWESVIKDKICPASRQWHSLDPARIYYYNSLNLIRFTLRKRNFSDFAQAILKHQSPR